MRELLYSSLGATMVLCFSSTFFPASLTRPLLVRAARRSAALAPFPMVSISSFSLLSVWSLLADKLVIR